MVSGPDVEPRVRRNVRVDPCLGVASVKDVIFVVTGKSGSAATQLIRGLAKKHPWVTDNFRSIALQGKGNRTPVADFPVLVDVIFVVSVV